MRFKIQDDKYIISVTKKKYANLTFLWGVLIEFVMLNKVKHLVRHAWLMPVACKILRSRSE